MNKFEETVHTMLTAILIGVIFFVKSGIEAQVVSPCPNLFIYEGKSPEPNQWYGIVTLKSDTDLSGVWLRLIFDRPSLQLGNWFGAVNSTDNVEYLIQNRNVRLKAYMPQTVRFFLKYDINQPPPKLVSFRLNAKTVCPEDAVEVVTTPKPVLQTSGTIRPIPSSVVTRSPPVQQQGTKIPIFPRPGADIASETPDEDDDHYPNDFAFINNTQSDLFPDKDDLNLICGTVVARPKPLITYGQPTLEGEFPWHAALYHAKGIDLAYICGASLISKSHVISVAHCVTKRRTNTPLHPDNLVVYLGKYYLRRFSGVGVQDKQVSSIIPHPQYNPQSYSDDIAIVKFKVPADITDFVRPVCLWQEAADLNTVINKAGKVVGWGFDETGRVTEELMQAQMPVVSQQICVASFPEFYTRFTSPGTYCAGFNNGTSVCNGDSGGGMVFPKKSSSAKKPVWQLRGMVSISVALQSQFKCDASHFVVFTDAAKYADWIKKSMKL